MNIEKLKEQIHNKPKTARTVVRLIVLLLALTSGRVAETLLIFGSYYLVHSQTGSLESGSLLLCALKMGLLWLTGIILGKFSCPDLLLYALLFLANLTIYLFAPVTGEADANMDIEHRRQKKNRAFFASGCISCLALSFKNPASTQLLIALLAVMLDIWAVFATELFGSSHTGGKDNR